MNKVALLLIGLFDTAIMTARCFKGSDIKIYGMDYDENLSGFSSRIINSIKTPSPKPNEKLWLEFLLSWLKKSGQKFILIPTSDEFVELTSKYYDQISEFCATLLPPSETINTIIERDKQFEAAINCGINVPYFIIGNHSTQIMIKDKLRFPIAVKPLNITEWKRVFTNKGFVIENEDDLSKTLIQLKDIRVRYLIQNIIEGENSLNYEVNSLYLPDGRLFQHTIRKIRQYPDRYGTATCIESCLNPEIEQLASEYIHRNNIIGFSNIEFKFNDYDNKYYYIETNPRVWLQINFSARIGLNFPMLYYKYLTNSKIEKNVESPKFGKWIDFLPDILFWFIYHKNYKLSLIKFIRSWFPITSTGLLSVTDPYPIIKDLKIKKKIMRIFGK